MAISYNIYANDGQGGDVNYASPIATISSLTYTLGPLIAPSDNSFGVRAFDTTSGIEEANTNVWVKIVIDPSGNDVTARPNSVVGLSARLMAGGTSWVSWGYDSTGQGGAPVQFNVFLSIGTTPSLSIPLVIVNYSPGVTGYGCTVSGMASNTLSTIAVQAVGALSDLVGDIKTVAISYPVNPLSHVESLVAIPSA